MVCVQRNDPQLPQMRLRRKRESVRLFRRTPRQATAVASYKMQGMLHSFRLDREALAVLMLRTPIEHDRADTGCGADDANRRVKEEEQRTP